MHLAYPSNVPPCRWVWQASGWQQDPSVVDSATANAALIPGWVNAHSHLELSHLRGIVPKGTGQAGFARAVAGLRAATVADRHLAQQAALQELATAGVVAVGDIANTEDTVELANLAHTLGIHVHTFVEVLGMDPTVAEARYAAGAELAKRFPAATVVPHAPYSVSRELFSRIWQAANKGPISLHFHESAEEINLFATNTGPLAELLRDWNLPLPPAGQTPASWSLDNRPTERNLLLVHCVEPLPDGLASQAGIYVVLCPRSNQYIHGTLPNVPRLLAEGATLCIGTDSLASNTSLNPLDELKCLTVAFADVPIHSLVQWATVNGAAALGLEPERLFNHPILLEPLGIRNGLPVLLSETQATPWRETT